MNKKIKIYGLTQQASLIEQRLGKPGICIDEEEYLRTKLATIRKKSRSLKIKDGHNDL